MFDEYVPLTDEDLDETSRMFESVIVPVMALEHSTEPNSDNYRGAFLGIRDKNNDEKHRQSAGEMTDERYHETSANIDGKNNALEANPDIDGSWEVHKGDLTKKPYPGAIRTRYDDRIAISGFSWQRDTIGCLWIAIKLQRISVVRAAELAELYGIRDMFTDLFRKLNATNQRALAA